LSIFLSRFAFSLSRLGAFSCIGHGGGRREEGASGATRFAIVNVKE